MLTILIFFKTLFKTIIKTVCCPDGGRHRASWCSSPLPISRLCAWLLSGIDDNIDNDDHDYILMVAMKMTVVLP